jgi:large subunit ribosomal protein L20
LKAEIAVDRKVLSDLAITEPAAFAVLVAQAKTALGYLGEIETTTHERISA